MAKFRLKIAHQMRNTIFDSDVCLPGDKENEHLGDEKGTLVGDGTPYPVRSATVEMVALDAEAEQMIRDEEARLARSHGSMNPIDHLPMIMEALIRKDEYEANYVPGFPGYHRPQPTTTPAVPPAVPKRV